MLEFLIVAFLSKNTTTSFPIPNQKPLPQVEQFVPAPIPQKNTQKVAPKLLENPRTAILAVDLGSGKKLLTKGIHRPQYIASITKLMTALIILEENEMSEVITIPLEATQTIGAKIDLYEYEQLTVQTLLEAILIPSANDAAVALAIHNAGTEEAFVQKMNEKAKEIGLQSALFYNATGLDIYPQKDSLDTTKGNQMSASDVARLAQIVLHNPFVRATVQKEEFSGNSVDEEFYHEKPTTNQLIGTFLNIKGLKTGYTQLAGQCLVTVGETPEGHEILTVVLGSEDRFGETKNLISWIYSSFIW